ncbi:P44-82 outer membrane protein, truncated, partial [Anaplasma phagocytophilum str. HZ]
SRRAIHEQSVVLLCEFHLAKELADGVVAGQTDKLALAKTSGQDIVQFAKLKSRECLTKVWAMI